MAAVAAASLFGVLGRGGGKAEASGNPPICPTSADVLNISTGHGTIGAPDQYWTVNSSPAFVSGPVGSYVAPPAGSQWINPTGNASDSQPVGNYAYSTSFTVPSGAGFRLSLQFAVDNSVKFDLTGPIPTIHIDFTGTNVDSGNPNESFQVLHPEAFVPGSNEGSLSPPFTYTNDGAAWVTGNYVVLTGTVSGTYTLTANVNNLGAQSALLVSAGVTCHSNPVGGITELLVGGSDSAGPAAAYDNSGGSAADYAAIVGGAAAAAVALAVAGWYTQRRWLP